MNKLTFNQLLTYNVHIGHGLKNTLLFSSWILYGKRQNLWMIDLKITFFMFKFSFKIVKFIIGFYGPFWFINLDKGMKQLLEYIGNQCGEFAIGGFWIRGLVTNFLNVQEKLFKKKQFYVRYSWPRCVFISSAFFSSIAVKECSKAKIPCISIIDTNVKSYGINLAIPGNDDNLDCVLFYNWFYANLILKEKYFQILLWFKNIFLKKPKNLVNRLRFFDNDNVFIYQDAFFLNQSIKYYSSSLFKNSFEKEFLNKENTSLSYLKKFYYKLSFLNYLRNFFSIQKSLVVKKLIFSNRRIKFYLKKYKRLNFKRMLYKNILRNKIYFIYLKYILFLRIFLHKKYKRKMITCNKISYNYFNFFYKSKHYKKNPFKWYNIKKFKKIKLKKYKILIKKIKFFKICFFKFFNIINIKKFKKTNFILKFFRIYDKRIDSKSYFFNTFNLLTFGKFININKWLRWVVSYQFNLKKLNMILYYIYENNRYMWNKIYLKKIIFLK